MKERRFMMYNKKNGEVLTPSQIQQITYPGYINVSSNTYRSQAFIVAGGGGGGSGFDAIDGAGSNGRSGIIIIQWFTRK